MPKMLRIKRVKKRGRLYHRGLSKQMTKDTRYRLSGRTHKKGTTAISWVIFSVTASRRVEATAGKESQRRQVDNEREKVLPSFFVGACEDGVFRKSIIPQTTQETA